MEIRTSSAAPTPQKAIGNFYHTKLNQFSKRVVGENVPG